MKAQKSEKYDYITALASARKFHDVGKNIWVNGEKQAISPRQMLSFLRPITAWPLSCT